MAEAKIPAESIEAGHELRDLSPKAIAVFAVSLSVLLIIVVAVAYFLHQHYLKVQLRTQAPLSPLSAARAPTPEPRLAVTPGNDLKALRAAEDALLENYAWTDRQQGSVRIPIDRAIELLTKRGLPTRAKKPPQQQSSLSPEGKPQ